jgi:membrane-associated phospholipid phosphatase
VVAYSTAGNYGIGWVVVGLLHPRPLRTAATVWGTLAVNYGVKVLVRRERPSEAEALTSYPRSYSFPSSHAAMSAAAAIVLSGVRPGRAPLWWLLAATMCLSRLHVGVHHASDVAVGAAPGTATGMLAVRAS